MRWGIWNSQTWVWKLSRPLGTYFNKLLAIGEDNDMRAQTSQLPEPTPSRPKHYLAQGADTIGLIGEEGGPRSGHLHMAIERTAIANCPTVVT
ncbi:hypothetical protein MJO29_004609 [Puccinia striiformis f. sp. tritici]|nr:hypothetical protein MJO29_016711 [Puccinia striiformis f. sp. tritici]KAI7964182.1 hypothetical protein MJO29_004609 [Puccinia striiformis f. sp. tritici]